ncbi:phage virion morphogenesis protein [Agrobacterium sp. DSM 25558]|uniref:phage virion morphogenesis protein n=1 Tax=Agrobacterium sp. DSM 25558 TaxID=1907665 RepID=UPI0009726004|nr:phage virion morphogenesis protein [Agrobacterium sp. DSM 25558]SCX30540.1 phage virion morphogenesis protein [Agrobacterium sp. DSM 25558]
MSGVSFQVTLDDETARLKLVELVERMDNPRGFYKNVGELLLNSVGDNFDNERGPDGRRWVPLSPVTRELRQRKYGNSPLTILRVTGALRGSYNYVASDDDVRIGTSKIQAALLHFGGQAGRNRKVTVPARPQVGVSSDDEREIGRMAEDWLSQE